MITVINKTSDPQQINFVDGSCITLYKNESTEIDVKNVRVEERERMKKFFKFVEVQEQGQNKRQKLSRGGNW